MPSWMDAVPKAISGFHRERVEQAKPVLSGSVQRQNRVCYQQRLNSCCSVLEAEADTQVMEITWIPVRLAQT